MMNARMGKVILTVMKMPYPNTRTHDLLDRSDEDLAVADLAGTRCLDDGLNGTLDHVVTEDHLDFDLGKEIDDILGASVKLGMTFLATETLNLSYGQPGNPDLGQAFAYFIELERFDDGFDFFHRVDSRRNP